MRGFLGTKYFKKFKTKLKGKRNKSRAKQTFLKTEKTLQDGTKGIFSLKFETISTYRFLKRNKTLQVDVMIHDNYLCYHSQHLYTNRTASKAVFFIYSWQNKSIGAHGGEGGTALRFRPGVDGSAKALSP